MLMDPLPEAKIATSKLRNAKHRNINPIPNFVMLEMPLFLFDKISVNLMSTGLSIIINNGLRDKIYIYI